MLDLLSCHMLRAIAPACCASLQGLSCRALCLVPISCAELAPLSQYPNLQLGCLQMYRVNAVAAQVQEILREYAHTSFAYLRPAQARSPLAVTGHRFRAVMSVALGPRRMSCATVGVFLETLHACSSVLSAALTASHFLCCKPQQILAEE